MENTTSLHDIFWLLIAALFGGIITYLFIKSRLKRASESLENLKKEFTLFRTDNQKKQKEAQVEILARDKKLASIKAQLEEVQAKEKNWQVLLAQKEDEKSSLLAEYDVFKTDTLAKQTELASAVTDQESQLAQLKGEYSGFRTNLEAQQKGIEFSSEEKEQLLAALGSMRGEIEILKGNFILKHQELLKAKDNLATTEQELRAIMSERDGLLALCDSLTVAQTMYEDEKAKLLMVQNAEKESTKK
jgi:chromosome segregation ATPase